ncbi:low temperature requirement protein A [Roseimicrobium sp. ORNL1]|uniref:low temperature requirement protein A n=1 Tax=Roseimicrobium sp. ORNL1 TaxID=2711231 RepID=UPI0013E1D870|nr:low temperature requirement protein A [Roseimicrobium sp. ORNL1]QIF03000.1 low temperature requirement protein A [Roseimicrobium sp. ORNL1]
MSSSEPTSPEPESLSHHRRRMGGRDRHEAHRVATPLELLFDLTFVIAFGLAASQFAHAMAEGHYGAGLLGFGFASFAISWAWINFSWFSSAYDTDDWIFRVVTMVQMIGVLVLAIGLPPMFASIEHGEHLDNSTMVLGYVIMRVAMVTQWLRAAKQDRSRRRACLTYATAISVAQIGWLVQVFLDFPVGVSVIFAVILAVIEMLGPYIAERRDGGTPWHAHHIAERYSCFAIIALGEGVVGSVATLSAVVEENGWTMDTALVGIAGTGLTFGMWWVYYMLPSAEILHTHRNRSFVWGYGLILVIASIVATGAGLHAAAYFIEHKAHIGPVATVFTVAIPVALFLGGIYALYFYLVRRIEPLHVWLLTGTLAVIGIAVVAASLGVGMATCLVIVMLAPVVTVVGYEVQGHRYQAEALAKQTGSAGH